MKLYHHKTDGGAEYLMDTFTICPNGEREGVFEGAKYIIRVDGDITKDAELVKGPHWAIDEIKACESCRYSPCHEHDTV